MTIQKISQQDADTHLKRLYRYWEGILIPVKAGMFYDKKGEMVREKSLFEIVFSDECKNIPKDSNGNVINGKVSMWALSENKRNYYLGIVDNRKYLYGINHTGCSILISSVAKLAEINTKSLQTTSIDSNSVRCLRGLIHDYLIPLAVELTKSSVNKMCSIQARAATDTGKHLFENLSKSLASNPMDGVVEPTFEGESFMVKMSE